MSPSPSSRQNPGRIPSLPSASTLGCALILALVPAVAHGDALFDFNGGNALDGTGVGGTMTVLDPAQFTDVTLTTVEIIGQDGSFASSGTANAMGTGNNAMGVASANNLNLNPNNPRDFDPGEQWIISFDVDVELVEINFAGWTDNVSQFTLSFSDTSTIITLSANVPGEEYDLGHFPVAAGEEITLEVVGGTGDDQVRIQELTVAAVPGASTGDNLVWAGSDGDHWNTTEANFTGDDTVFETGDNVEVQTAGTINIDPAGITAGATTVSTTSGTVSLAGGDLVSALFTKSGGSTLEILSPVAVDTGADLTVLGGGKIQVMGGASFTTGGLSLSGGAEFRVDNGGTFATTGVAALGDFDGGTVRANSGTSLALAGILNTIPDAAFRKAGSGTLTISGDVGLFQDAPVYLDFNGGDLIFDGPNLVAIAGRSGEVNSWQDAFLVGTDLVLHNATLDGGTITVQGTGTRIRTRFNYGVNTIDSDIILEEDLIIESPNGNNDLTINGVISGPGNLSLGGNGDINLSESSTYTGTTTLEPSNLTVVADSDGTPLGTGDLVLGAGTTLDLNSDMTIPGAISGEGAIQVDGSLGIFGGELVTVEFNGGGSHSGPITLQDGWFEINGTSTYGTTRGVLTVENTGSLGGNGSSEHHVVMEAGGALTANISDWTGGVAGTDYDDLYVHSFDGANVAMDIRVFHDLPAAPNFDESTRSFAILKTSPGGITNFDPGNVTIIPRTGFTGTGTWSVTQDGDSIVLTYTTGQTPYEAWIEGYGLAGADADPEFDYEKDGSANILEFVLGGNPTQKDAGTLPTAGFDGTDYTFSFERSEASKGAVSLTVKFGSDLTGWTDLAIPDTAGTYTDIVPGTTVVVDDGDPASLPDTITVTIPSGFAVKGKLFAYLFVDGQ